MDIKTLIAENVLLRAYNEAAKKMNGGMLNSFNKNWEDSGKEFGTDEYVKSYYELFRSIMQPLINSMTKYLPFVITIKEEMCALKPIGNEKYEVQWMYDLKKK